MGSSSGDASGCAYPRALIDMRRRTQTSIPAHGLTPALSKCREGMHIRPRKTKRFLCQNHMEHVEHQRVTRRKMNVFNCATHGKRYAVA
jgi:hypothetical protein